MLYRIDRFLENMNNRRLLLFMLLILIVLGVIDFVTGNALSFSVFYTGPIMLAAWYGGRLSGVIIALTAAAIWLLVELTAGPEYSHILYPLWNTFVRLAFYVIILQLMLSLRDKLSLEENLADTDPLTGLVNRRFFQEQLEREFIRLKRYLEPFTLATIDLDNFKAVNDSLGHHVGDELLCRVAGELESHIRDSDIAARLGGDEFALLFPLLTQEDAVPVVEKLQQRLLQAMMDKHWPVTFSIGVVTFHKPMATIRDTLKKVDDLMYEVKKTGKNNIRSISWP